MLSAPMVQQLLDRLPEHESSRVVAFAMGITGIGFLLWLVGARVSRSMFALVGVALGAWIGLRLPRWMGWDIDAMAISIGGALLLGFAGFLLHMAWVGLMFGTLLTVAGVSVAWYRVADGAETAWKWPTIDWTSTAPQIFHQAWEGM